MLASLRSIRYYGQRCINKHIRFLHLHYLYIALIIFIFSGLYYCQHGTSWAYIDALYMATTGCTNTGINTIPISLMSTFQVSVLYFSSFFGSHIVISLVVVMVRKHYFSKRFHEVVLFNKARKLRERQRWRQSTSNSWPNITRMQSAGNVSSYYNQHDNEQTHSRLHDIAAPSNASPVDASSFKTRQETQHGQHLPQPPSELGIPIDTMSGDASSTPIQLEKEKPPTTATQLEHATIGPRTASRTSLFSSTPMNGGTNIIFAENIQQQREDARQRLQEQRKMEVEGQDMGNSATDYYQHFPDDTIGDGDSIGTHEYVDVLSLAQDQTELTREQRYLVGGAEYRALDLLTTVIPAYYLVIVLGASFAFRVYIAVSPYAQNVLLTSNGNNIPVNPWYFSFFICLSAMNNLGLSHLDDSMVPFQNAPFPLLICGFLVLAGNTAYPIFLRFMLWCMYHVTPRSCNMHGETLRYLLDHPRRCYTTLFPSLQTWWLLVSLLVINLTEVVVYTSTNFWLPVMDGIPVASQVMDGLFQAIATRNAGFSVVNLASLNPGTILVYIVAMYISVYPVAISMRNSNVYQERSLGMYRINNDLPYMDNYDDDDGDTTGGGIILKLRKQKTINSVMTTSKKIFSRPDFFVMTQIQRQLTRDICWVMAGIFCICVLEARSMMSPSSVTFMSVVYECVSAFGCVGGSLGGSVPGTSQSVDYRTVSKLVLIILMYRGRHRGLPASIDRSVLLPSEQLERSDTQEQQQRLNGITTATGSGIIGKNIGVVYHRSETV